jgi:hypothetical protein
MPNAGVRRLVGLGTLLLEKSISGAMFLKNMYVYQGNIWLSKAGLFPHWCKNKLFC